MLQGILQKRDQAVFLEAYHTYAHTQYRKRPALARHFVERGCTSGSFILNDNEKLQLVFDDIYCHAVATIARTVCGPTDTAAVTVKWVNVWQGLLKSRSQSGTKSCVKARTT